MKKLVACIICFCAFFVINAAEHQTSYTNAIELMGFVRQYHVVTIQALFENASESLGYGMPFDITKDDVSIRDTTSSNTQGPLKDKKTGRHIANWSIVSTYSPIEITINASKLTHLSKSTSIDYYLCFRCEYATFNDSGTSVGNNVVYLIVSSDGNHEYYINDTEQGSLTFPYSLHNSSTSLSSQVFPIVSSLQDIRFMLHDYTIEQKEDWPGGYYGATITIEIIGG